MEIVRRAFSSFMWGVVDCGCGMLSILRVVRSQEFDLKSANVQPSPSSRHGQSPGTIKDKLFGCAKFGVIFWLCNQIFNRFFLQYFFNLLAEWTGEDLESLVIIWYSRFLYVVFCLLWILPLFVVSKLLNFIWYQDIADLILQKEGIKKNTSVGISDFLADLVKSLILQMFYCFQGYAVYFLPLPASVQYAWYLFHLSLLTSLYAFEYKWVHLGWPLHRRLLNIDRKWPYYLGFGFPLAFVTTMCDSFIDSIIVFATLFPVYVISSAVTSDVSSPIFYLSLHSFKLADSVSDGFISFVIKLFPIGLAFFGR